MLMPYKILINNEEYTPVHLSLLIGIFCLSINSGYIMIVDFENHAKVWLNRLRKTCSGY